MHGFYIEKRKVPVGSTLSADLAQHIFIRGAKGLVVVLTDKPHDIASITKKQWHELIRKVERERSSTLNAVRIAEFTVQAAWMRRLRFTIHKPNSELSDSGIVFVELSELLRTPPICSTLYITCPITNEDMSFLTSWLPKTCVVVIYT